MKPYTSPKSGRTASKTGRRSNINIKKKTTNVIWETAKLRRKKDKFSKGFLHDKVG